MFRAWERCASCCHRICLPSMATVYEEGETAPGGRSAPSVGVNLMLVEGLFPVPLGARLSRDRSAVYVER